MPAACEVLKRWAACLRSAGSLLLLLERDALALGRDARALASLRLALGCQLVHRLLHRPLALRGGGRALRLGGGGGVAAARRGLRACQAAHVPEELGLLRQLGHARLLLAQVVRPRRLHRLPVLPLHKL